MINILSQFSTLLERFTLLKENQLIIDFRLSLRVNNEIDLFVLVSNPDLFNENLDGYNVNLNLLTESELNDDGYLQRLFGQDGNFEINNSRRRFSNLLNFNSVDEYRSPCPVVSFYSYKGGMGRSTTIATCATYLASHYQKRIVIIDCDFEAPGFSSFFLESPAFPKHNQGIVEYILDKDLDDKVQIEQYLWEVSGRFSDNGAIYIMPAGNLNDEDLIDNTFGTHKDHYLEGLARLDFASNEYIVTQFRNLISEIHLQLNPDYIFIDSRTGFSDVFGLAAIKLSSFIVGFFGNSVQNLPGLYFFIDLIRKVNSSNPNFIGLLVNSFSRPKLFQRDFTNIIEEYINKTTYELNSDLGPMNLYKFFFSSNAILERVGTSEEDIDEFIGIIKDKSIGTNYIDLFEKIKDYSDNVVSVINSTPEIAKNELCLGDNTQISSIRLNENKLITTKKKIFSTLLDQWPDMYAENIDYDIEYKEHRYFYRQCMQDLFNFDRFLILGNKGTGKSYIYQSLKHDGIVNELKKRANKSSLDSVFYHLVDKTTKFMLQTSEFEAFSIEKPDLFFKRFWIVYSWSAIMNIQNERQLGYQTDLDYLPIKTNDTELIRKYFELINDTNKIIEIEKDLIQLDEFLKAKSKYLMVIYDNLDEMVMPHKWYEQIAPLLNLWKYSSYNRIIPKLFIRRDLFNKISGVTNIKDLENKAIDIEWSKEEIFAYFFKLVLSKSKEDFFMLMASYNDFPDETVKFIKQKSKSENQYPTDEFILRKLSETFFGKFAENPVHGESYDWLYKNLMNANDTISIRPFIDLMEFAIRKANSLDTSFKPILPPFYYTSGEARKNAAIRHLEDLIVEKGNKDIGFVFDFIDKNTEYQYYEYDKYQLNDLFENVINEYKGSLENNSKDELERMLIINGIIRKIPLKGGSKYTFAFLYKYRLGLKNRKNKRR